MASFSYSQTSGQDELIDRVEYQADKVTPAGQSVGINRSSVYQQLGEAGLSILRKAPKHVIKEAGTDASGQTASNVGDYTQIQLPPKFLRFMSLKLETWDRAVYELVDERSNQWRLQGNSMTQADVANPVAALIALPTVGSGQVIHAYPQDSAPAIGRFAIIEELPPEDIPDELKDIVVLEATGRVLQAQKEAGAEAAYNKAAIQLRQLKVGKTPMRGGQVQVPEDSDE